MHTCICVVYKCIHAYVLYRSASMYAHLKTVTKIPLCDQQFLHFVLMWCAYVVVCMYECIAKGIFIYVCMYVRCSQLCVRLSAGCLSVWRLLGHSLSSWWMTARCHGYQQKSEGQNTTANLYSHIYHSRSTHVPIPTHQTQNIVKTL